MKKNGFTLVELLSIVVILGIIVVVALPQISGSITSKKEKQYNKIIKIVENAGKIYLIENNTRDSVSIDKLIESDYLTSGLKNPINNTPLTGCVKKITSDGVTKYKYEVDNCPDETIFIVNYITSLYNNESTRKSNGLKKDNTEDKNIRYYGSNPNNYVKFNNELWRIIGVFGNNVKLIRKDSLGSLSWDSSDDATVNIGNGLNKWGTSFINDYLNTMYYGGTTVTCYNDRYKSVTDCPTAKLNEQAKELIYYQSWNSGFVGDDSKTNTVAFYGLETETEEGTDGYIGLPYVTDWAYASSESICETNMQSQDSSNNYICKNDNWMHNGSTTDDGLWTLSAYTDVENAFAWKVSGNGNITNEYIYQPFSIFPTLYLPNVIITGGLGTSTDPYELSL